MAKDDKGSRLLDVYDPVRRKLLWERHRQAAERLSKLRPLSFAALEEALADELEHTRRVARNRKLMHPHRHE